MQKESIEDKSLSYRAKNFFNELKLRGFKLVICVPCSLLQGLISYSSQSNDFSYIVATNEGEAVAIAVGAKLAGQKALIVCQNSGLGNMVNPLSSLSSTFDIPLLIVMSWRGNPNKIDAPQHKLMGNITLDILNLLNIKVLSFPCQKDEIKERINTACQYLDNNHSCCLIVEEKIDGNISVNKSISQTNLKNQIFYSEIKCSELLTRKEALQRTINFFSSKTIFVSTTGEISRELFELNDSDNNLYMVGSMGYASSIGLGISLYYKNKVVVFDGDSALLMHMGNMATIGHYAPSNFCHIVLDNKVHATTGGQENSSKIVDFLRVAKSCNYPVVLEANKYNIESTLRLISENEGPHFIHIEINSNLNKSAGRPQLTPPDNAVRLSNFIRNNLRLQDI